MSGKLFSQERMQISVIFFWNATAVFRLLLCGGTCKSINGHFTLCVSLVRCKGKMQALWFLNKVTGLWVEVCAAMAVIPHMPCSMRRRRNLVASYLSHLSHTDSCKGSQVNASLSYSRPVFASRAEHFSANTRLCRLSFRDEFNRNGAPGALLSRLG